MKKMLSVALAVCMVLSLAACGKQPASSNAPGNSTPNTSAGQPKEIEHPASITICASTSGNTWYASAVKISELMMTEWPDMSVTVIEGGGDANIDRVNAGTDAQLGFTSSTSLLPALSGANENVKDASNVAALMSVSMSYAQTAVLASSDIQSYEDLAGKRMAAGTYGQVAMYTSDALLESYGMSAADLAGGSYQVVSPSEYPDQFSDGHLDACHINGNIPLATLVQIDSVTPIRLLQPSEESIEYILEKYPAFYIAEVESGKYAGMDRDMKLLAYDGMLIGNKDLPGEFLARVVELITEANEAGELVQEQAHFSRSSWENYTTFVTAENTVPEVWDMISKHQ